MSYKVDVDNENCPKYYKKRGEKKEFAIEYRNPTSIFLKHREWTTYFKKYKTEKQRDKALESLIKRAANSSFYWCQFEYRVKSGD